LAQASTSEAKERNLRKGEELISQAGEEGCDILVLPELFMVYAQSHVPVGKVLEVAEPVDGPFVKRLRGRAQEEGVHVAVGILGRDPDTNQLYDTALLLSPDGSVLLNYRKTHLYDAFGYRESARFGKGMEMPRVAKTPLGNLGLMICYELRFPEVTRHLALAGAHLALVPSAWFAGPSRRSTCSRWSRPGRLRTPSSSPSLPRWGMNSVGGAWWPIPWG